MVTVNVFSIGVAASLITSLVGITILSIFRGKIGRYVGKSYWLLMLLFAYGFASSLTLLLRFALGIEYVLGISLNYLIGVMSWAFLAITMCLAISILIRRT